MVEALLRNRGWREAEGSVEYRLPVYRQRGVYRAGISNQEERRVERRVLGEFLGAGTWLDRAGEGFRGASSCSGWRWLNWPVIATVCAPPCRSRYYSWLLSLSVSLSSHPNRAARTTIEHHEIGTLPANGTDAHGIDTGHEQRKLESRRLI